MLVRSGPNSPPNLPHPRGDELSLGAQVALAAPSNGIAGAFVACHVEVNAFCSPRDAFPFQVFRPPPVSGRPGFEHILPRRGQLEARDLVSMPRTARLGAAG
jgi:hypothetical protein